MATQNTTTLLLDERRESRLREQPEALVKETADALIQEAYRAAETLVQSRPAQRQLKPTYPTWPTSTPGPQATLPLPGMKPLPMRTDQMVYECYNQECGVPCTAVPERPSRDYANAPSELYHSPRPSGATTFADISDVSWLGKHPPTPAETGHYHYGPLGPGINTDASGSYAPHEIDPYGRLRDRPVQLYITGKKVRGRTL